MTEHSTLKDWKDVIKPGDVFGLFDPQNGWKFSDARPANMDTLREVYVRFYRLPRSGDATDAQKQAALLYWKLYLDMEEYRAAAAYDFATSFCSNCPSRTGSDKECCKDNGLWEQDQSFGDAENYTQALEPLMRLLAMFAGETALKEVRAANSTYQAEA